jgi:chromosome segregation ATPase
MALSIASAAQSLGQATSLQLEVQGARNEVARAEQNLRSLERQASEAQREADSAGRRAAGYRTQAGQARAALGQARVQQGEVEFRQQAAGRQDNGPTPFEATASAPRPLLNAEGQTLGRLLDTTA